MQIAQADTNVITIIETATTRSEILVDTRAIATDKQLRRRHEEATNGEKDEGIEALAFWMRKV